MTRELYIGIDPGVNTGFAVWNKTEQKLDMLDTMTITQAMKTVEDFNGVLDEVTDTEYKVVVFMEDARQRNWFGQSGREKLQGAGSVKRDCAIWETFCQEADIELRKIAPKNNYTKLSAEQFRKLTGWKGRTSDHARDAAMLVFGR